jgi:3-oxoadipate enol-lactonase/4-carboxymuconolactone decarboxylase
VSVTPSISAVRMSGARHRAELPLLVLGPSLGTSAATLWSGCAAHLADCFDVLAWDLPGHGHNRRVPEDPFTVAELAAGVLAVVDDVLAERGEPGASFSYAGNSVGGAVGLQLLLDEPSRVRDAVLLCTGARIGSEALWADRIEQVSESGTAAVVPAAAERWFAPGFLDHRAEVARPLLQALAATADQGYRHVCCALAAFDVRERLAEVAAPVLAVAGALDVVTPIALLEAVADGVQDGRVVELEGVAHLAPAEVPEEVARLIRGHALGEGTAAVGAVGAAGLDPRSRSLVALTALVVRADHDRLPRALRNALDAGITASEIDQLLLQAATYCPEPDATTAHRIARAILDEEHR